MCSVPYLRREYTLPLDRGIRSQNNSGYINKEKKLNTPARTKSWPSSPPQSRIYLKKITVTQVAKKFLAFYDTQRFITVTKSPLHVIYLFIYGLITLSAAQTI
jgi:hypothetical protein